MVSFEDGAEPMPERYVARFIGQDLLSRHEDDRSTEDLPASAEALESRPRAAKVVRGWLLSAAPSLKSRRRQMSTTNGLVHPRPRASRVACAMGYLTSVSPLGAAHRKEILGTGPCARIRTEAVVISNGALDLGTQAATLLLIKKYLAAAARQVPVGILPGFSCSVWPRLRESFGVAATARVFWFGAFACGERPWSHRPQGQRTPTKLANAFGQLRRRICSTR